MFAYRAEFVFFSSQIIVLNLNNITYIYVEDVLLEVKILEKRETSLKSSEIEILLYYSIDSR